MDGWTTFPVTADQKSLRLCFDLEFLDFQDALLEELKHWKRPLTTAAWSVYLALAPSKSLDVATSELERDFQA